MGNWQCRSHSYIVELSAKPFAVFDNEFGQCEIEKVNLDILKTMVDI